MEQGLGFLPGVGVFGGGVGHPPLERIAVKFLARGVHAASAWQTHKSFVSLSCAWTLKRPEGRAPWTASRVIRQWIWTGILHFILGLLPVVAYAQTNEQRSLVLVIGAAGEPEYGEQFSAWAQLWKQAAAKGGLQTFVVGEDTNNPEGDREQLLGVLTNEVAKPNGELWLVLIGHGTYDGRSAKFNLRGPDISADELAAVLKPAQRPLAVIDCSSASGPFINSLSAAGRVIITATRSGNEVNVTRFGGYLAHAVADPSADLDKDGQTSLLEAFLFASREVDQFYRENGRLATEHALLDDNGDGLGTSADWFHGVRAVKIPPKGKSVDGIRANQLHLVRSDAEQTLSPELRAQRDMLEKELSDLRSRKDKMDADAYYRELEKILLAIAKLYQTQ